MEFNFSQRRGAKYIYVLPTGLNELMCDISREVLRNNSEHLYSYIADYLESLLITRENARVVYRIVDQVTESGAVVADLLSKLKITKVEAKKAAKIIQRAYRIYRKRKLSIHSISEEVEDTFVVQKILKRLRITLPEACYAAQVIQRAYRRYRAQLDQSYLENHIDWRMAAKGTIFLHRQTEPMKAEEYRASTLIKAAYKAYYTRNVIKDLVQKPVEVVEPVQYLNCESEFDIMKGEDQYSIDYDVIQTEIKRRAAIVIQRTFRAYNNMKNMYY